MEARECKWSHEESTQDKITNYMLILDLLDIIINFKTEQFYNMLTVWSSLTSYNFTIYRY